MNFHYNKPHIMKKSKYQQYFHCFIVCILILCAFWFSFQQNIGTILIGAVLRGAALIRRRCLFQCGYPKVRRLLEGDTYLSPGVCQGKLISLRKYGELFLKNIIFDVIAKNHAGFYPKFQHNSARIDMYHVSVKKGILFRIL